jgi:hypothetical protein
MNPLILGPLLDFGKNILDRFIENPDEKRKAEMELIRLAADGELRQVLAQLEINAREAQHQSIFVAGWRPFFGWSGGAGFIYAVMLQPFLTWYATIKGWPTPPTLNSELLWTVITGMLGIGGLRSIERIKGAIPKGR